MLKNTVVSDLAYGRIAAENRLQKICNGDTAAVVHIISFARVHRRAPMGTVLEGLDITALHNQVFLTVSKYETIMQEGILSQNLAIDEKTKISFSKKLLEFNSYMILNYIWRCSDLMRAQKLASKPRPVVTCYSIAKRIAHDNNGIRAANEAVGAVCRPAAAYGLIEQTVISANKVDILGTPLLHAVMVGMSLPHTDVVWQIIRKSVSTQSQELR